MKTFNEYLKREERFSALRDKQWQIERDRRRTREERRMRRITLMLNVVLCIIFLVSICVATFSEKTTAKAAETEPPVVEESMTPVEILEDQKLEAALAAADVNKPAQEPVTYEDWFRAEANQIEDCMLTHYCVEKYKHICGTGDGITSTGVSVTAGWTCAVDKDVIPYGAEVMVDYGDHVEFYKAQDCGPWIKGNHIDLAVETHAEAEALGIKYATVYWLLPEEDPT